MHNLSEKMYMIFLNRIIWIRMAILFSIVLEETDYAGSVSLTPSANVCITQKSPLPPATDLPVGTTGPSGGTKSSRSLLKFDIAGNIPSNAIITSAALTVNVTQAPPAQNRVNSIFDLRAVLLSWSESDGSWTNRLVGTPWSVLGGAVGVDFSSLVSQTNFFTGAGAYTFISNSNLIGDVQNWLHNPGTNFGWILISESQGVNFTERTLGSRQDFANTPTLLVQFTIPATPPTITLSSVTNGVFRFYFNAESNRTYVVQYVDQLSNTNWSVLTNFSLSSIPTNFLVSDFLTTSNRFYRVQTP
jgi:hypothetical protein